MNFQLVAQIVRFCDSTNNYFLPTKVRSHIMMLNYLFNEWVYYYEKELDAEIIYEKISEKFIGLIDVISENRIPFELVQPFSEIIVCCVDQMSNNDKLNDLMNAFTRMTISYESPNNLANDFSLIKLE